MPAPTWDTVFADITDMLRSAMGDFDNELVITPESTFRDDIGMESIDVVALAGRLQAVYGNAVNFALFVAGDEAAIATDLRVGQLVTYIVDSLKTSVTDSDLSGVTATTA
ncbi:phosphopantetheine-binding protein [Streptomyces sp. NPDC088560]|uniref:phosphopantetheine-binding protein n=1 Tax=Streptomyces sp. NPDC088560 TaxID=3365868 RepID=UPI0038123E05